MDEQSYGQGISFPDGKYLRSICQSTWMAPSPTKSLGVDDGVNGLAQCTHDGRTGSNPELV